MRGVLTVLTGPCRLAGTPGTLKFGCLIRVARGERHAGILVAVVEVAAAGAQVAVVAERDVDVAADVVLIALEAARAIRFVGALEDEVRKFVPVES